MLACLKMIFWQVRERTQYATPWRQNIARSYKNSPDVEVNQIMSGTTPEGSRYTRGKLGPRDAASPRHLQSPGMEIMSA